MDRDIRAPEILSVWTAPRGYLLRRWAGITILVLIDVLSLALAEWLTHGLAALTIGEVEGMTPPAEAGAACLLVLLSVVNHLYGLREARRLRRRRLRAAAWFVALVTIAGLAGLIPPVAGLTVALLTVALLTAGREVFDLSLRVFFGLDPESRRTIIVGSRRSYDTFVEEQRPLFRPGRSRLLGIVGEEGEHTDHGGQTGLPHLGRLADLDRIADLWRPDELVVVDQSLEEAHLVDLAELCKRRRMTLKLMDLEMRFSTTGVCLIPNLSDALFVAARAKPSGVAWAIKRSVDVIVAAILLVALSPLFLTVAAAIRFTSPGPVFYSAERVGLGQRRFRCHKFRTMYDGAHLQQAELEEYNEVGGAIFKIRDDPRVTRVGRWLRSTSIDELPQLVNVLFGSMSIVGPRPLPVRDDNLLDSWHKQRHVVLPGLTGLWQVSGRSDTTFQKMIRLDLEYVDNWSLWLDVRIISKTITALLSKDGAY